ncbi:unnamed protein product [Symbiodinium microadriaticum]|nr:unnamed protein product [Symbiodinium microadriaticum]CAE7867091.1 unnamed protein product [Symbiodinium sp. KB8]
MCNAMLRPGSDLGGFSLRALEDDARLKLEIMVGLLSRGTIGPGERQPGIFLGLLGRAGHRREALPLPLFAVIQLEQALSSCEPGDWWPILCFLLMLWAGLRWSDAQRLDFESVILDGGSVRGWCWRTKTSATGMPWGAMCSGACGSEWGRLLAQEIVRLREEDRKRDFVLRHLSKPAGYAAAVATFRRCLVCYTELDAATAMRYTPHSLKVTTLCWAGQLSKSVEKYRRLALGPDHNPVAPARDDDAPTEDESASSGSESPEAALGEVDDARWYHKAVCLDSDAPLDYGVLWEGKRWGRICRPQARCQSVYEVAIENPFFRGYSACRHAGCFGQ